MPEIAIVVIFSNVFSSKILIISDLWGVRLPKDRPNYRAYFWSTNIITAKITWTLSFALKNLVENRCFSFQMSVSWGLCHPSPSTRRAVRPFWPWPSLVGVGWLAAVVLLFYLCVYVCILRCIFKFVPNRLSTTLTSETAVPPANSKHSVYNPISITTDPHNGEQTGTARAFDRCHHLPRGGAAKNIIIIIGPIQ